MEEFSRPDPDALLAKISKSGESSKRGKLKIFFGMCPGVGKTYAMLQAARQRHDDGVEVLIGFIETHGRKDTMALIEGLPVAERTIINYRNTQLEEMDLDPILTWHPKLVIVDELAHTNVPGSRHPKRYQDVLELLDAGIDVYTTLNVQHVESRKDTVSQITGIEVRETVPDSILDLASEITLIDLTPSQLRTRLAEGKVYLGERAFTAAENFFSESNLMALREMALRLTAEHVDRDLRILKPLSATDPWKAGDRLLVAIGPSPSSEKLIRWTRRMASTMEASWLAVYIETAQSFFPKDQAQLTLNLALARELGAEVIVLQGVSIGPALIRIATQHNVSQIIIGKPGPRSFLSRFQPSFVDWLVSNSGEIDVHLVRAVNQLSGQIPQRLFPRLPKAGFAEALSIAAIVTVLGFLLEQITGYRAIALFYLLGVIFASLRLRRIPTLFLATLSAALWDYLFIPPKFTFYVNHIEDFMMLAMNFVVAIAIGHLTTRLRERELAERHGEKRATALYRLSQALTSSDTLNATVAIAIGQIKETFDVPSALILCDENGFYNDHAHPSSTLILSEKEESVAAWVFLKKQISGRFTDTLPNSEALHLPLVTRERTMGVLAIGISSPLTFQQRELLETFVTQIALALEKDQLSLQNHKAQVNAQSEQLQRTLFDSVSHELKTPLAAISAALDQAPTTPILKEIRRAVERLTRVVNHLLDMTRLDSGLLKPTFEWCDPEELIREALEEVQDLTRTHQISCEIQENTSPILVDDRLLKQVLITLLTNAVIYSPPGSLITISYLRDEKSAHFSVSDSGGGIKKGEDKKIFEKFYRIPGTPAGGIGLGLSVAKRLIEAHEGNLIANNRKGGGACFTITLPVKRNLELPSEYTR